MADPALTDLNDNLKALRRSLDEMKRAADQAKGSTDDLVGGSTRAAGAVGGLATAVRERLGAALSNVAAEAMQEATAGLEGFVRSLPEAAARSESHARALEQLGGAYAHVRQATNGAVSAEQAAAVQQRALQSGLRLSAQELAAVTQRAREFARSTGTDVGQALEQLTDQLVDPGEELRKFGVFLQTGMNAGDAMRETLRQLGAQAASSQVSQMSLAESIEATSRAQREASDALAATIAQRLDLRDFFVQLTSWLDGARSATSAWTVATDALVGTLREAVGLRSQIGDAQGQSRSGAFMGEVGGALTAARARVGSLGGFQPGELATRGTATQQAAAMAVLRQAAAGGMTREQAIAQLNTIMGRVRGAAAEADAATASSAAAAAAARAAEIARRNRASTSSSSSASASAAAPDVRIDRTPSDTAGFALMGDAFRRAREQAEGARGSIGDRTTAMELRRASAEAAGTDRVRILREQREALSALVVEAQREEELGRLSGRNVAEMNDLMRQRIGLQTALAANTRELVAAQQESAFSFEEIGNKLIGVLDQTTDAFAEGVVAALEGSKSFAASMDDMVRSTLRSLAKLAIVEALKEGAQAVAAVATGRVPQAVNHGIAAGLWAGVAVAAGAGVAAMGPPSTAGASGGGASSSTAARADRAAQVDSRDRGGPLALTINVSGAAFTDAGVQQAIGNGLREAIGTGVIRREHLNGLLGG